MWLSCVCPGACIFYARVCVVVCFLDAFSCAVRRRKGREQRCSCFFFISIDQKGKLVRLKLRHQTRSGALKLFLSVLTYFISIVMRANLLHAGQ